MQKIADRLFGKFRKRRPTTSSYTATVPIIENGEYVGCIISKMEGDPQEMDLEEFRKIMEEP